ncbi:MAG TPA: HWE histidine kinase domain-containing protein [Gemmatimonadaceae bacterium]
MQVASRDSELQAEIARLRDLLEREKLDSRRGEEQIRFQARLLDAVHEAVIATDPSGIVLYWNHFAEGLYGWTAEEAVGRNILELTPAEEDLRDAEAVLARLRRGEPWSGEITLRRRDGSSFPGHVSDAPVYDDSGRLIAIVGISYNISERKEAEEKQALLVRELHHRVKNTLTTVQAIMGSTARASNTTEEFQQAFTARIASLARTHSLLTDTMWQSVPFQDLLQAELEPYDDGSAKRITLAGPAVELPSELAVPIGMAVDHQCGEARLPRGVWRSGRSALESCRWRSPATVLGMERARRTAGRASHSRGLRVAPAQTGADRANRGGRED